jgi:hypothetical protein
VAVFYLFGHPTPYAYEERSHKYGGTRFANDETRHRETSDEIKRDETKRDKSKRDKSKRDRKCDKLTMNYYS